MKWFPRASPKQTTIANDSRPRGTPGKQARDTSTPPGTQNAMHPKRDAPKIKPRDSRESAPPVRNLHKTQQRTTSKKMNSYQKKSTSCTDKTPPKKGKLQTLSPGTPTDGPRNNHPGAPPHPDDQTKHRPGTRPKPLKKEANHSPPPPTGGPYPLPRRK